MAPYELTHANGSIYIEQKQNLPSIERLRFLANTFRHAVWLNPRSEYEWDDAWTIDMIRQVFPMFELSLDGLEKAVQHLMARH
jgi:hypothetical protein